MPLYGRVLGVALVFVCWSCGTSRRTTASLPSTPSDGPRLAEEIRLVAGGATVTGKLTALRGDTVIFLPAPYWGEEVRTYPLDRVTAVEVNRRRDPGLGFAFGFAAGFTYIGVTAGNDARYDEDYSGALVGAGLMGLVTGVVGAAIGSGTRITVYDLRRMSAENRRELVRRLMARDGAVEPGSGEGAW